MIFWNNSQNNISKQFLKNFFEFQKETIRLYATCNKSSNSSVDKDFISGSGCHVNEQASRSDDLILDSISSKNSSDSMGKLLLLEPQDDFLGAVFVWKVASICQAALVLLQLDCHEGWQLFHVFFLSISFLFRNIWIGKCQWGQSYTTWAWSCWSTIECLLLIRFREYLVRSTMSQ